MGEMVNYYFDAVHPLKPCTHGTSSNSGSLSPINATRIKPEFKDGFWPCWNGSGWEQLEEHRNQKAFDIETGAETAIKTLGPLPGNLTLIPKPGPAYRWGVDAWVYEPSLDSPGPDYDWDASAAQWLKKRFSKKDFLMLCGFAKIAALNMAINAENILAKTVHDLLMAADFIDVSDPATVEMVQVLTTGEAGAVLTTEDAARILQGVRYAEITETQA